jgi:hypothetical protein
MKTKFLIAAVLMTSFIAQAQKGFAPTASLNKPFILALGSQISLKPSGAKLLFLQVTNDSRCPINAKCITAGNAQMQFLYWSPKATKSKTISLQMVAPKNKLQIDGTILKVSDLQPGRTAGKTFDISKYKATLTFIK